MHMSDALVSPPVAAVMGAASIITLVISASKIRKQSNENIAPLMGVMGAFIFAAQMLNFTIPGTGSSGHIVGGILLASVLGPWAAYLTLASVLVIQALFFADGGLMALGCNIFNMGVLVCLVAYPLVFKPLTKNNMTPSRISLAAILACVVGLELGAFMVTIETELSGITALPIGSFLLFMLPIHIAIGIIEGIATVAVLLFLKKYKPELLEGQKENTNKERKIQKSVIWIIASLAILFGGVLSWYASSNPDGLEWSISKMVGEEELQNNNEIEAKKIAERIQEKTSFMPDYEFKETPNNEEITINQGEKNISVINSGSSIAGIAGGAIVLLVSFIIGTFFRRKKAVNKKTSL